MAAKADIIGSDRKLYQSYNLSNTDLREAVLTGFNLQGVNFYKANLKGAKLEDAKNLEPEQIQGAFGNSKTLLPANIEKPAHWM